MSEASKFDELQDRFINFSVLIIKIAGQLPSTTVGRHVAGQILRSGTSPAPNYGEARGAESRADFIHKFGIVLKELNETAIHLHVIQRSELLTSELVTKAIDECAQLGRISTSSIKTASQGKRKQEPR